MTKRKAITILQSILEEWESSRLNRKAAREILARIQKKIGMLPPYSDELTISDGCKGLTHNGYKWDKPKKKRKARR